MELYKNVITDNVAKEIMSALPQGRSDTYLNIARGNPRPSVREEVLAARLYVWNGYLASAVDRITGEVEVLLRNCMDEAFSQWNSSPAQGGSREWLCTPEGRLAEIVAPPEGRALVDWAHIETVEGAPLHDDYVAGLTFGNWVHLLPKPHAESNNPRVILWEEALRPRVQGLNRVVFQQRAMAVKDMRNRATHRRPLIKDIDSLQEVHQNCVELAKAINPSLGVWLRDERWVPEALKKSPLK